MAIQKSRSAPAGALQAGTAQTVPPFQAFIKIADLSAGYQGHPVVHGVSLNISQGSWLGIIGPNGSGKTTLLRALSRYLKPEQGAVYLDGRDLSSLRHQELAQQMATVGPAAAGDFDFTVGELVLLGRTPHLSRWRTEGNADWQIVERAMRLTDTTHLAERYTDQLSSGERQRVLLARALAQQPQVLLLDEPTSHLDIHHQIEVMELLDRLRLTEGLTLVSVMHDLNLASLYCGCLALMSDGKIHCMGSPWEVLSSTHIGKVYGCEVEIRRHPHHPTPQVTLLRQNPGTNRAVGEEAAGDE